MYYPSHNYVRRVRCVEFVTCKTFEYVPLKDESSNNAIIKSNVTTPKPNAMPEPRKNPERVKNKPQYLSEYVTDRDSEMSKLAKCYDNFCYKIATGPNTFNEAMLSAYHPSQMSGRVLCKKKCMLLKRTPSLKLLLYKKCNFCAKIYFVPL